jgi:hypothetical protein
MKRFAMALISGLLAAVSFACANEEACTKVTVQSRVEVKLGELTLADLLARGTCPQLRQAAAQVTLGTAPRAGSVRVLDGRRIRSALEGLAGAGSTSKKEIGINVPERIVVQRAGATKSCAEIARFLAGAASAQNAASVRGRWLQDLDCAAARDISEDTPLELTKTVWNPVLQRWEFALRCARPEDCVPFLVWAHAGKTPPSGVAHSADRAVPSPTLLAELSSSGLPKIGGSGIKRLVKPGQTATLTWDQAGIRVVLPVTCLDAGGLGEFVRVRLKNAARILRAEVVGEGILRASL